MTETELLKNLQELEELQKYLDDNNITFEVMLYEP